VNRVAIATALAVPIVVGKGIWRQSLEWWTTGLVLDLCAPIYARTFGKARKR